MRAQPIAEKDGALAETPEIRRRTPWRVATAQALPGYRLRVRFADGLEGVLDMSALVASPEAGIFAALADIAAFNRVSVQSGAVTWPGELDIAPDAIHAAIRASAERLCVLS